jgi:type III pantothenate kinase
VNSQPPSRSRPIFSGFLLIDISNSFTKFAFASREKTGRIAKVPTRSLDRLALEKITAGKRFGTVVLSSVVPEKERVVARFFKNNPLLRVGPGLNLGVGIDYPKPARIGADRLANAASAVALYGAPVVVVDFGTAVTFDIISPEKKYIGGVIAPGLEVMTDYLYQRTALLPKINLLEPVSAVGKSTRAAMMAGAVFGYRGLVSQIIAEIKREISPGEKMRIVATGGYAGLIAAKLPEIQSVHPGLTLEGLRIIGCLNAARQAGRRPCPARVSGRDIG